MLRGIMVKAFVPTHVVSLKLVRLSEYACSKHGFTMRRIPFFS